jgi:hypothetical protein
MAPEDIQRYHQRLIFAGEIINARILLYIKGEKV